MTGLPSSIETYLTDAGFTATELIVLHKLLEGEALTLRELAARTGKSTGVLDQAVKKLLGRGIVARETVNAAPKLLIKSLGSILDWVRKDTEVKFQAMKSRAQNFESFIASLERESIRPEMEYFEGREGIVKAYEKLLTLGAKELLFYLPVTTKEEEDPLCAFRVQYFRERRRAGVFSRILVPESPLGRRYRSRDPFEYRKSELLPESVFPITFEKVIAGDTVACFTHVSPAGTDDLAGERACFLHFPELARSEREMFELLWRRAQEPPSSPQTVAVTVPSAPRPVVPLSTRSLSSLREFFLSRKSVALFAACALLAGAVTWGLWRHNLKLNRDRVKERAMAIAATAATEFDARTIAELRTKADAAKPEFMRLVERLRQIKARNRNIKFVYIDRPTGKENPAWEVVADADYGTPDEDFNGNGIIEDSEQLTMPGQEYPYPDPLLAERLKRPTADILTDEWGEYVDASAPIFDAQGNAVAALFVDIDMQEVRDLTRESFQWTYLFLCLFFFFVFVRLAAFHRLLFMELLGLLKSTKILVFLSTCAFLAAGMTWGMYRYTYHLSLQRVREQVKAIAATAAPEFQAEDLGP